MDAESTLRERCIEVIAEYAESLGRPAPDGAALASLPIRDVAALGMSCQDYLRFGREVDAVVARTFPPQSAVMVRCDTPRLLRSVGCANLPMLHTQRHILNELSPKDPTGERPERHGLALVQVKLIAEALDRPCAVLDSPAGKSGIVCVLDMADSDGFPAIMPFAPNGKGQYMARELQTNFILSVYGKRGIADYIDLAARDGRILFLDRARTSKLLSNSGLRLPGSCRSFDGIIAQTSKPVNDAPEVGEKQRDGPERAPRADRGPGSSDRSARESAAKRNGRAPQRGASDRKR